MRIYVYRYTLYTREILPTITVHVIIICSCKVVYLISGNQRFFHTVSGRKNDDDVNVIFTVL